MKYYVRMIKTFSNPLECRTYYKRCKCIDEWSFDRSICWKFSKQGARGIIKRLEQEHQLSVTSGRLKFDMIPAEEE